MSNATYSAHIGPDAYGAIELVIHKAVPAGLDGPHGSESLDGLNLQQAEVMLAQREYKMAEPWQLVQAYDGLRLEAKLLRG